jgi:hypothetical protein
MDLAVQTIDIAVDGLRLSGRAHQISCRDGY